MISLSGGTIAAILITCLSMTQGRPLQKLSRYTERMNSVVQYLTTEAAKHQVIFLLDTNDNNRTVEFITFLQHVIRKFPSISLTFGEIERIRNVADVLHDNSRQTTLFVMFLNTNTVYPRLMNPIRFLLKVTRENVRPKCLIVHTTNNQRMNYYGILQRLWKLKFLDVTILQSTENESFEDKFLSKENIATLHQLNPYSKIYTVTKNWNKSQWFPDKSQNLNRVQMRYVPAEKGYEVRSLFEALSRKLNFTIDFQNGYSRKVTGLFNCKKATGSYQDLLNGRAQFIMSTYSYLHRCKRTIFKRSRIISLDESFALVPKSPIHITVDIVSWEFLRPILKNCLAIISLYFILRILKFHKKIWRPINIFLVTLGSGLPTYPKSFKERFVLVCLLFGGTFYSGYIHSLLTDMELKIIPGKEINSFEELLKSSLPVFSQRFLLTAKDFPSKIDYNKWIERTTVTRKEMGPREKCLRDIVLYKNISCILPSSVVNHAIENEFKKHQKLKMKLIDVPVGVTAQIFWLEPGAPFGDSFDKEILKFTDTGLMKKWRAYNSEWKRPLVFEVPEIESLTPLYHRVLMILASGLLLATVVFIGEVVASRIKKWRSFKGNVNIPISDLVKRSASEEKNKNRRHMRTC